jgi:hypothetical protein
VQALTRIVAHNASWVPKAVNVINVATQMMNGQFKGEQQQQQQQQAGDAAAEDHQQQEQQQQRVLVFQPLKVCGCVNVQPDSSSVAAPTCLELQVVKPHEFSELGHYILCCSVCSCLTGPAELLIAWSALIMTRNFVRVYSTAHCLES